MPRALRIVDAPAKMLEEKAHDRTLRLDFAASIESADEIPTRIIPP